MISGGQISKHGKKVGGSGKGPILFDRDIVLRKRGGDIQFRAFVATGALEANGHLTAHNGTHNGHVSANGNFTVYTTADGTTKKFDVVSTSGAVNCGAIVATGTVTANGALTSNGNFTVYDTSDGTTGKFSVTSTTGALASGGVTANGAVSANGNFTVYTTADGTTSKFSVTSTSGDVVAAGDVTSESDRRLKKDIVDIEHAVETVKSLQGVKYRFKEGDDKERIGLIAQDVEPYVPQVVFEKEDDGMKSVSYQSLVALLIEAVKEQQKEIDELKAQVWLSR